MKASGKFTFLGTSASAGVPMVGCKCAVCTSASAKNQRLRPSGLLRVGGKSILIDVGPDFRTQAIKYKIDHLDGLLLTHTHFDHIAGIDDLRAYYLQTKKKLPCLLSKESLDDLKTRYDYLFRTSGKSLSAQLAFTPLPDEMGQTEFLGLKIGYVSYIQSGMKVNGFRLGDFAYISDIREYEDSIFGALKGVKNLVLSALREEPSDLHFTMDEAIAFSRKVGAEATFLTHISHAVDHEAVNKKLPVEVRLGFDGFEMEFHE